MKDLLITMPEPVVRSVLAAPEDCYFFHRTGGKPKWHEAGDRVFFVFSGFVRGFGRSHSIRRLGRTVSLDGRVFRPGWYLMIYPDSWRWITPLAMRGFQGFRYSVLHDDQVEVVGDYRDAQPAESINDSNVL